jgi:hypothetical protein
MNQMPKNRAEYLAKLSALSLQLQKAISSCKDTSRNAIDDIDDELHHNIEDMKELLDWYNKVGYQLEN